jgi:hypothetical protein
MVAQLTDLDVHLPQQMCAMQGAMERGTPRARARRVPWTLALIVDPASLQN